MSKVVWRFVVVVLLIVGITTAVYFILNKPDASKKVYDDFVSLQKTSEYSDYGYLTKEIEGSGAIVNSSNDSLNLYSDDLDIQYAYANAIKEQIEKLLHLSAYIENFDSKAQKEVIEALKKYNDVVYGDKGVSSQAKYLYNYLVAEDYDPASIGGLKMNLLNSIRNMQSVGRVALDKLVPFIRNSVYQNATIVDIKFVLYDLRGMVASGENAQYESLVDKNQVDTSKFVSYVKNLTNLIETGESNGFNTLNDSDMREVLNAYNNLGRAQLIGLFRAVNSSEYLSSQEGDTKSYLITIYNFLEG